MQNNNTIIEIALCSNCNGLGMISERINSHESDYVKCKKCKGNGRLIKTTEIKYEAFDKDKLL